MGPPQPLPNHRNKASQTTKKTANLTPSHQQKSETAKQHYK